MIKLISTYFFALAIYSMRNVLFVSHDNIIYKDNIFLITYLVGDLIFAIPCIISCIIIWRGLKRKWMKVFSLITAVIYEILFLIGTVMCFSHFLRFHQMWLQLSFALTALLLNTYVIFWLSKYKAVNIKGLNEFSEKDACKHDN